MKILALSIPEAGHVNPMIPQVLELLARGHEVVFATLGPARGMPGQDYDDAEPVPLADQDTSAPFHSLPRRLICERLRLKIDGEGSASSSSAEPSGAAREACSRYTYVSLGPPANLDHIVRIIFNPQSPLTTGLAPLLGRWYGGIKRLMLGRALQVFDRFGERYEEFRKLSVLMHGPEPGPDASTEAKSLWRENRPELVGKELVKDILNGTADEFLPIPEALLADVGGYNNADHRFTSRRFDDNSYKLLKTDPNVKTVLKNFYPDLVLTDATTPAGGDLAQILDVPFAVCGWSHIVMMRLLGPFGLTDSSANVPHLGTHLQEQVERDWERWERADFPRKLKGTKSTDSAEPQPVSALDTFPLRHLVHAGKRVRRFILGKINRAIVDHLVLPEMYRAVEDFGVAAVRGGQHTNSVVRPEIIELRKRDGRHGEPGVTGARNANPERIVNDPTLVQPAYLWNDLPGMGITLPLPPSHYFLGIVYENQSPIPPCQETLEYLENTKGAAGKPRRTVLVSFGSMVKISPGDAKLIFRALERVAVESARAGGPDLQFLWSLRLTRTLPNGQIRAGDSSDVGQLLTELGVDPKKGSERVRVRPWVAQGGVLRHRNVAAFFTHGGINSMHEGILNEKPLIALPFGGDQFANAQVIEGSGVGWYLLRGREKEALGSRFAAKASGGHSDAEAALKAILFDDAKLEAARGHIRRWRAVSDFQGGARRAADVVEHLHRLGTSEHAQLVDEDPRLPAYAEWDLDIWLFLAAFWYAFVWRGLLRGGIYRGMRWACCGARGGGAQPQRQLLSGSQCDTLFAQQEELTEPRNDANGGDALIPKRPPSVSGSSSAASRSGAEQGLLRRRAGL